jgi:hypothetical protein
MHASPEKRISLDVRKFRADLIEQKLDGNAVDDSHGSLDAVADAKRLTSMLSERNNSDSTFPLDMFEPFIVGRDLNPCVRKYSIPVV